MSFYKIIKRVIESICYIENEKECKEVMDTGYF